MTYFIQQLSLRNPTLFYFGVVCLVFALIFLVLTNFSKRQVYNVSAWYKPFKFAMSTFFYSCAMAWFCFYLPGFNVGLFSWSVIVLLGFEIIYIALQASKGQLSHYNQSTPVYTALYAMMAIAATLVTLYTAYIGILFFTNDFPLLPDYYLWGIRLGIIIFVIFSFEGFVMGTMLKHTIGGEDGDESIPILNWSKKFGDPRIPHFIGMHALQALPIMSFYLFKNTKATIFISLLYFLLAVYTLVQALRGKPLFKSHQKNEISKH